MTIYATLAEYAAAHGVEQQTVRRWASQGMPHERRCVLHDDGTAHLRWLIPAGEADDWLRRTKAVALAVVKHYDVAAQKT